MNKNYLLHLFFAFIAMVLLSCNSAQLDQSVETKDSTQVIVDTVIGADTSTTRPSLLPEKLDTAADPTEKIDTTKLSTVAKGYALVNCPGRMIKGIPGIVIAQVTKKELSAAINDMVNKLYKKDSSLSRSQLLKQTQGDSITLFKKMKVVLEVDSDDIKNISGNNNRVQEFTSQQTLEWQWTVKPLIKKEKTIVTFNFYGIDDNNQELQLLQKSISIGVEIDVRTFVDKWIDFLFDDAQTTVTAILIPLITFLGGFLVKKKQVKQA